MDIEQLMIDLKNLKNKNKNSHLSKVSVEIAPENSKKSADVENQLSGFES